MFSILGFTIWGNLLRDRFNQLFDIYRATNLYTPVRQHQNIKSRFDIISPKGASGRPYGQRNTKMTIISRTQHTHYAYTFDRNSRFYGTSMIDFDLDLRLSQP